MPRPRRFGSPHEIHVAGFRFWFDLAKVVSEYVIIFNGKKERWVSFIFSTI